MNNQAPSLDWKSLPDGREKYHAYLCSSEWGMKRAAVERRSNRMCERKCGNRGGPVHHLTYIRKYDERIEDLIHLLPCLPRFPARKRDRDPVLDAPVILRGCHIKIVYLAGKITQTAWRDEIMPGWSRLWDDREWWSIAYGAAPIPDGRSINYRGPYWRDVDGNGKHGSWHDMRGYRHAYVDKLASRRQLADEVTTALAGSDLLFAWIDTPDYYGTIAEISFFSAW